MYTHFEYTNKTHTQTKKIFAQRVGTKFEIDQAMKLGTGIGKGPLELADFIGLDTCLNIMRVLQVCVQFTGHIYLEITGEMIAIQADLGGERYRPCPLLTQYVNAGRLGECCC